MKLTIILFITLQNLYLVKEKTASLMHYDLLSHDTEVKCHCIFYSAVDGFLLIQNTLESEYEHHPRGDNLKHERES
jgi:hypothetical protein